MKTYREFLIGCLTKAPDISEIKEILSELERNENINDCSSSYG